MKTIQAVLYQRNKKDKAGIIKIRVTENRKHSYISVEEKLLAKHWDSRRCLVKETEHVDYERINIGSRELSILYWSKIKSSFQERKRLHTRRLVGTVESRAKSLAKHINLLKRKFAFFSNTRF